MKCTNKTADRFGLAQTVGLSIVLLTLSAILFMIADIALTGSHTDHILNRNAALVKTLGLTHLSLLPSGHMLRHPEFANAGVNLRYTPLVFFSPPDPAELLISSSERQKR